MKKEMNNKGFSLVELIIVIAIMAVLVGILAPQYLKYVRNSRISTDITNAEEMATALNVAIADPNMQVKTASPATFAADDVITQEKNASGTFVDTTTTAPASKYNASANWIVTYNNNGGVSSITLGGTAIWPSATAYEALP